jgi:NAD(P)-dependent dehydrogenase (short-subunit alcohol dehydrogenase family)/acyl-CoA thioesterase FadM
MNIQGHAALVTGGGSGLGEATARELARLGAKVAVLDLHPDNAQRVAKDIGGVAVTCNVADPDSMQAAIDAAAAAHGPARILMQIAGIGSAKRVVGKDGNAAPLADFARVINVNLIGTYNAARLFAAACAKLEPMEDGERGVMVFTASVAAFDGQVGQQAYSASKAGVVGMTLPMARDLAQHGIRVCTIAPGLFLTPLMKELPEPVQESLAKSIPFPSAWASPRSSRSWRRTSSSNGHLNGEVIRLDGAFAWLPAEWHPMSKTVVYEVEVMFGDCDPAGIVFFPNFSKWMDASSLNFFVQCGVPPWRELVKTTGIIGTPLLEIHTRFMKPATYGERLQIHTSVIEWREKVLIHKHLVKRGDDLLCEGEETRAFCMRDPANPDRIKAIPIPEDIRLKCS